MLRHIVPETGRDTARQSLPSQPVTTVGEQRPAANASRWTHADGRVRRLRRRFRFGRTAASRINGWTVRTW